jgi:hypothetical protein
VPEGAELKPPLVLRGGIVLSTGTEIPVDVRLTLPRLTKAEERELEAFRVTLHDLAPEDDDDDERATLRRSPPQRKGSLTIDSDVAVLVRKICHAEGMDRSSFIDLLLREFCRRVHPDWVLQERRGKRAVTESRRAKRR